MIMQILFLHLTKRPVIYKRECKKRKENKRRKSGKGVKSECGCRKEVAGIDWMPPSGEAGGASGTCNICARSDILKCRRST